MRELLHLHGHTPQNKTEEKWFERDDGDARLARDRELIKNDYPYLKYGLNHREKRIFLRGKIVLIEEFSGVPTNIEVKVIFPDFYPQIEPTAYDADNQFEHVADRHFYPDGRCCLWLPPESEWRVKDDGTLLNFLNQVAVFFERQLIFDASGEKIWAWGSRGHNEDGFIEYIQEKLRVDSERLKFFLPLISNKALLDKKSRCPCGSKRPYRYCHFPMVNELNLLLGGANYDEK